MNAVHGPLDLASFPNVLVAARAGEAWAVEQLFTDLQPRLLRFLRTLEPSAADDLAGEVWVAIARNIHEFEGDLAGFRAFAFVIARRRLADHRRSAGRHPVTPMDGDFFRVMRSSRDTASDVVDSLSAQEAVDFIVGALPDDQAELLMLRVLGQLEVLQVAEILGRTPNWVRVTQHRALRRLAEVLGTPPNIESFGERVMHDHAPAIYKP